jgi:hypothetical protein
MTRKRTGWRRALRGAGASAALRLEMLETRTLLSASSMADELIAQPLSVSPLISAASSSPRGFFPSQIREAYGFNQISFNGGIAAGDGRGQTIAIVAAYDHPTIASDLQVFNRTFGLPDPPSFVKVNQNGGAQMPGFNAQWAEEIALDVQWAHAMAPGANILLVEANSGSLGDLLAAVDTARHTPGVSVVSMSWGITEFAGQGVYDQYFTTPAGHSPVTFVAAAGDNGAQAVWPAISSNVIAVGGTALRASTSYISESGWNKGGGGYSSIVPRPDYQWTQGSNFRTTPDISYVANPDTGVSIYNTAVSKYAGWFRVGGTSAGAPQWAALVAIVDQGRALNGQPALGDGHLDLYRLPSTSFHDVVTGNNGNQTNPGYDLVTGRGSPIASEIVKGLVAAKTAPVAAPVTPAPTPSPAPTTTTSAGFQLVYQNHRWMLVPIPNAVGSEEGTDATVFQAIIVPSREMRGGNNTVALDLAALGTEQTPHAPRVAQSAAIQSVSPIAGRRTGKAQWVQTDAAHTRPPSTSEPMRREVDSALRDPFSTTIPATNRARRPMPGVDVDSPATRERGRLMDSIDYLPGPETDSPIDSASADNCLELDEVVDDALGSLADRLGGWEADVATLAMITAALASRRASKDEESAPRTMLNLRPGVKPR